MNNIQNLKTSQRIRESYAGLPFQSFWSWLTGKELSGRVEIKNNSRFGALLSSTALFFGGVYLSSLVVKSNDISNWFLIFTSMISVAGARYIVATMIHQAVHNSLFDSTHLNRIYSELFSTILVVQPFDSYRKFHVEEHHSNAFSTLDDKDLSALYKLGFTPGTSVSEMKRKLFSHCISPKFHLQYLIGRIKSNFVDTPLYRKTLSFVWLSSLVFLAYKAGPIMFSLVVIIPFVFIYQVCSLLHLITEHLWVVKSHGLASEQAHIDNCLGRFNGREMPSLEGAWLKGSINRLIWFGEHLVYHLPIRLLVLQGTLTVHDWHHRYGAHPGWANTIQLREEEVQAQIASGDSNYIDVWGFHNVINYVLESISNAEPITEYDSSYEYRLN